MEYTEIVWILVFTTLVILLLIAGIVISVFISKRQRLQQEIKLDKMELAYQKELRNAEAEIGEQVLTHIARELHDNIGQMLTYMYLQLQNKKLDDPELTDTLQPIEETVTMTSEQVRLLSRSLNTDFINKQGFTASLQTEVKRLQQLGKPIVHFYIDSPDTRLDNNQSLIAFRIFQEIINNALKHARARNIFISVSNAPNFNLEVRDDGTGFDYKSTLASAKASGLQNMVKRASLAGLTLFVESSSGNGCRYLLQKADN